MIWLCGGSARISSPTYQYFILSAQPCICYCYFIGGMLAGHDESGGELIEHHGKKRKIFYGMSSDTAMKKHAGGVAEYRASEVFTNIFYI